MTGFLFDDFIVVAPDVILENVDAPDLGFKCLDSLLFRNLLLFLILLLIAYGTYLSRLYLAHYFYIKLNN